ncbi:MAG: TrmB family transcriptional regulator [Thermoplasmatota archaeon]|nr:hypothetical protein [Halobacteriales archaeon]
MPDGELASRLEAVGMHRDQASAYVQLHGLGASKAAAVARALSKTRPQVYRLLEAMAQRGFVTVSATRPHLFTAVAIQTVLDILNVQIRELVGRMQRAEKDIVGPLREAHGRPQPDGALPHFTLLRGNHSIVVHASSMVNSAKRSVDMVFTHQGAHNGFAKLTQAVDLDERSASTEVRLLVCRNLTGAELQRVEGPRNGETRIMDTDTISTSILTDDQQSLVIVSASHPGFPGADGALAFLTTVPEYVAKERLIFDKLWATAERWNPTEVPPPGRPRHAK